MITGERHAQGGFTLLEVLMAILVFTFGVLSLFRLQAASVQNNSISSQMTQATTLAQDRMERLMALSYSSVLDTNGDGAAGLSNTTGADQTDTTHAPFTVYWNVADYCTTSTDCAPLENTRKIRIIVTWRNWAAPGSPHTVTLECVKPDII